MDFPYYKLPANEISIIIIKKMLKGSIIVIGFTELIKTNHLKLYHLDNKTAKSTKLPIAQVSEGENILWIILETKCYDLT